MNLLLPLDEPRSAALTAAVEALATTSDLEERGAVFTQPQIVDAIVDLCGYTADVELERLRLLEPSFGEGEFLLSAIDRLLNRFKRSGIPANRAVETLRDAIRGVELHRATFFGTRSRVIERLRAAQIARKDAEALANRWLENDDFLLANMDGTFDFVVGNPPYVRQERIPDLLLKAYRQRYETLYDRADLYVLFYERGLDLLRQGGVLGYICANRWMKNKYGGPLRQKVDAHFHLKFFIDLERANAFASEVIAYPAITVIERSAKNRTLIALNNRDETTGLKEVVANLKEAANLPRIGQFNNLKAIASVSSRTDPWLLDNPAILKLLRQLEDTFPKLEEADTKVGIGVATGADRIYIGDYDDLPVEETRKLRLAMAADCMNGNVQWGGKGVVNPYLESGQLAPLEEHPLFAAYLKQHQAILSKRHTAKKQPARWYKTIDRIYPQLTHQPKLLIPDIKGDAAVSYDDGVCYPHHNLYVITSQTWNLRVLQAILRSSVALMFVAAYSVRMAGGFLRFQAQYLRRIRCPQWNALTKAQKKALAAVATEDDTATVDAVVLPIYGLKGRKAKTVRAYASAARVPRKGK